MTAPRREFVEFLQDILENTQQLKVFLGDVPFSAFETDDKTQYAIARALEIIGETAKRTPLGHFLKCQEFGVVP